MAKVDYLARETLTNLRRNVSMASAGLLIMAISLSLVGGALLVKQGVDRATIQFRGGVELSVFLRPDASDSETQAIASQLRDMPEVKRFRYVDKPAAFAEFKKMFGNEPEVVDTVSADTMPPSFRIVPRRAEDVDLVGERFRNAPGVEKDGVQYARDVVKPLLAVTNFAQAVLWIMAVGSLVAGVLLILNTIRMAIFNRRREVAVMKLVGATNWFIRVPFMLEGMVQGVVGALVAAAIVWGGRNLIQSWIQGARNLQLFKQFYVSTHDVVGTAIFLVVLGAIVGAAGSAVGVNRFLDV